MTKSVRPFFIVENSLSDSIRLELKIGEKHTLLFLQEREEAVVCEKEKLGRDRFFGFERIHDCYDSIMAFRADGAPAKKDFSAASEWTFLKKDDLVVEYRLVIDSGDF